MRKAEEGSVFEIDEGRRSDTYFLSDAASVERVGFTKPIGCYGTGRHCFQRSGAHIHNGVMNL